MQLDIWMFFIVLKYAESENHSGFSCIAPQVGVFLAPEMSRNGHF